MVRMPALGCTVLVLVDPRDNNGTDVAPATITRVWTETNVNVRVHHDAPPRGGDRPEWMTSVQLYPSREALEADHVARAARYPGAFRQTPAGAFWPPPVEDRREPGDRPPQH